MSCRLFSLMTIIAAVITARVAAALASAEVDPLVEARQAIAENLRASAEQIASEEGVLLEDAVLTLLNDPSAVSEAITDEEVAALVNEVVRIDAAGVATLAASDFRQGRVLSEQQNREILVRVKILALYAWLREQAVPIGIGLALYVALLVALRRRAAAHRRRATLLKKELPPAEDARLAESEEALSTGDEEAAALAEERRRAMEERTHLEREIQRIEQRAELFWSIGLWVSTLLLIAGALMLIAVSGGIRPVFGLLELLRPDTVGTVIGVFAKIFLILLAINLGRLIVRLISARIMRLVSDEDDDVITESEMRAQTLLNVLNGTTTAVLWVVGVMMILSVLSVPIAPLLTGIGILGLAVGFGAQSLVRDFISGFFILMENQFRVGDVVMISGTGGLVERITMRTTTLRDLAGRVHIFPNGEIMTVTNMTYQWSRHVAEIGVSYNSDPDRVIQVLLETGAKMREEEPWKDKMIDNPEVLGLDKMADSAIVFKVLIKTKPLQQWATGREYNRRVFYALRQAGIEIPFPHRTVYHRMEEGDTINVFSAQAANEESAPSGIRRYLSGKHVPPVVPEEAGDSD